MDKHKLAKKRKVHFADGEHQANKAYQAVDSVSSSPSKSPLHEPTGPGMATGATPDLLQQYTPVQGRCKEEKLGAGKQAKDGTTNGGWLMEEQRNRLLYRQPAHQPSGQKQLMPLQVGACLYTFVL